MYQTSGVELISLRATMGIRAHPGLTSRKTSSSQISAKPYGCAGQTVRPSLHVIEQTSAGSCLTLSRLLRVLCCLPGYVKPSPRSRRRLLTQTGERWWRSGVAAIPVVSLSIVISRSIRICGGMIVVVARQHRPSNARKFVGERYCQQIAVGQSL